MGESKYTKEPLSIESEVKSYLYAIAACALLALPGCYMSLRCQSDAMNTVKLLHEFSPSGPKQVPVLTRYSVPLTLHLSCLTAMLATMPPGLIGLTYLTKYRRAANELRREFASIANVEASVSVVRSVPLYAHKEFARATWYITLSYWFIVLLITCLASWAVIDLRRADTSTVSSASNLVQNPCVDIRKS